MAHVEPQFNAAEPVSAMRGVCMAGIGKDSGLPSGGARSIAAPVETGPVHPDADQADPVRGPKVRAALSELTRTRLSVQLRAMYDSVAQQPVPDRFADLIARLDAADREKA